MLTPYALKYTAYEIVQDDAAAKFDWKCIIEY